MQHKLCKERRFYDTVTEGLTWSWTLIRAAFLLGLGRHSDGIAAGFAPPEGPPEHLPALHVHILHAPMEQLFFCPTACFRDLRPGISMHFNAFPSINEALCCTWLAHHLPGSKAFDPVACQ